MGVIGAKPPHLLSPEERKKVVAEEGYVHRYRRLQQGRSRSRRCAAGRSRLYPSAAFVEMANGKTYLSKAFDDRVGVALVISALQQLKKSRSPQRRVRRIDRDGRGGVARGHHQRAGCGPGCRHRARVGYCRRRAGHQAGESTVKLGKGPTVIIYEARMIPNLKLRQLIMDTAEEIGVPVQISYVEGGATDGGVIHLHATGVPTAVHRRGSPPHSLAQLDPAPRRFRRRRSSCWSPSSGAWIANCDWADRILN